MFKQKYLDQKTGTRASYRFFDEVKSPTKTRLFSTRGSYLL